MINPRKTFAWRRNCALWFARPPAFAAARVAAGAAIEPPPLHRSAAVRGLPPRESGVHGSADISTVSGGGRR